jgi:hypothetical protein
LRLVYGGGDTLGKSPPGSHLYHRGQDVGITTEQILTIVGLASACANAIFWAAFLLGKIWSRIERLEMRVEDHDQAIREFKDAV